MRGRIIIHTGSLAVTDSYTKEELSLCMVHEGRACFFLRMPEAMDVLQPKFDRTYISAYVDGRRAGGE